MKFKTAIIFLTGVLSVTLVFVVDMYMHPYFGLQAITTTVSYEPVISRVNFIKYFDLYCELGLKVSAIFLIMMTVILRRACEKQLKRLMYIAVPLLIALFIQFLLVVKIDAFFYHHDFIGFVKKFFVNLPAFFTAYMPTGLLLFLVIMITCYPVGILIDKLLLYITSKIPKHSQG